MSLLGAETITVTPQTQTLVDGRYQLVPGASYTVTGTVLPIPGQVLAKLPEAARTTARYVLYVEGDPGISTTDNASPEHPADRVTRKGFEYTVASNLDLSIHASGLPHRQFILHRKGGDE
jgi:hypothetical protein